MRPSAWNEPDRPVRRVLLVAPHRHDGRSMHRYLIDARRLWRAAGYEVAEWTPPTLAYRLAHRVRRATKWLAYVDKYIVGIPSLLIRRHAEFDVVHVVDHSDALYLVALGRRAGRPTGVVTVHDMTAIRALSEPTPGVRPSGFGRMLQRANARGIIAARARLAVSEATAADTERLLGVTSLVVPNFVADDFRPGRSSQRGHLLAVATAKSHKARAETVALALALAQRLGGEMPLHLVGPPLTARELAELREAGVDDADLHARIRPLGTLDDEQLRSEYEGAIAYLSMSRYEGFGWPIVEANATGTPAVLRDTAVSREVGGAGALYVTEGFPELTGVADRLHHEYARLQAAALQNAQRFTFASVSDRFLQALESIELRRGVPQ